MKYGELETPAGWTDSELEDILKYSCVSKMFSPPCWFSSGLISSGLGTVFPAAYLHPQICKPLMFNQFQNQ